MNPARILVVDDLAANRRLLQDLLRHCGYEVSTADSGASGLYAALNAPPDLILLDVLMPDMDGFSVCRCMREAAALKAVPIVMVTTLDAKDDLVRGLEAGADDFLSKPVMRAELQARVQSLLRVKSLHDAGEAQRKELADWSALLEQRVQDKLKEIEQLSELKRFFSPRLAERLLGVDRARLMASHRREVTVLFADLRGFTAFAERADAARVMQLLREFHGAMGELIFRFEGTLERFTGDGMMVFFNDPDPIDDHAGRAVALACAMRDRARDLMPAWQSIGGPEGLGIGLSSGPATIGVIGFESRVDYAAIGSVTNRAARLCGEAPAGEVLVCAEVWRAVHERVAGDAVGALRLKGFAQPVPAWRIDALCATAAPPTSVSGAS